MKRSNDLTGAAAGAQGRLDSGSRPPATAAAPRQVIRGESHTAPAAVPEEPFYIRSGEIHDGEEYRFDAAGGAFERHPVPKEGAGEVAHVDWIAGTIPRESVENQPRHWEEDIGWFITSIQKVCWIGVKEWKYTGKGWGGYKHKLQAEGFGLIAYGGESQKGTVHFEITGEGCAKIHDWEGFRKLFEGWSTKITRLDLAHDDHEGRDINIEQARLWHAEGGFSARGRPPTAHCHDDCGSGKGKTFYVGSRPNGKLCRVYEKGRQLGDPQSPWVRVEVEWRAKDRVIPWDAVTNPGPYLAGAYPCLAFLNQHQDKIKTVKKQVETTIQSVMGWLHRCAGKALNATLQYFQGDISAALGQIIREGYPARLGSFGVYLGSEVYPQAPAGTT